MGARLGQLGYLGEHHCRLQALEFWKTETDQRAGIIIGRRDQLGGVELPTGVAAALASLGPEQGLMAEFFLGFLTNQHRVLLVSGADDAGLTKAALTLGSAPALTEVLANPAVIEQPPEISAGLEAEAGPTSANLRLADGAPVQLRGLYRSEQSLSNWRLPPGFQLGPGSALHLQVTESPLLVKDRSWLEVLVNDASVATLPLGAQIASSGSVKVPLPRGLDCRDPMNLTFRATLNLGAVDCAGREEENAWVKISGDSTIETVLEAASFERLSQLQQFLLTDRFGRQAAYVVPASPSLEQVRALFALWLELGRNLPSSPVLWPEVVTYERGHPPAATRLKSRSVLLLGSVAQWPAALPPGGQATAVVMTSPDSGIVEIQGRHHEVAAFEPTLVFAQWLRSPWSEGGTLVVAGGWKDYATPALKRLLLDRASVGQLHGDLVALDALGRGATYDLHRVSSESLAERIQRRVPSGLSVGASAGQVAHEDARWREAGRWNRILFFAFGLLLLSLVLSRLWLMWEQGRFRKRLLADEREVGGTT